MGRPTRIAVGGLAYHVINRSNGRVTIFETENDFLAFLNILKEAKEKFPTRILSFCLMPNHWHLVLWPIKDGELSAFTKWVSLTHAQRWHAFRQNTGSGHLYQGRFKSFPIQTDRYFITACRYVERNPLRAGLVHQAENWRWSSLSSEASITSLIHKWPIPKPSNWIEYVNQPQVPHEEEALRLCIQKGRPYGEPLWIKKTAITLGLTMTLRNPGRPKNGS